MTFVCGFKNLFFSLEEKKAGVGRSKVAGNADEFIFVGAGAAGETCGFHAADGRDGDGETRNGRGDIKAGEVQVVIVADGAYAGEQFLYGFHREAVGNGEVDGKLRRRRIHSEQVRNDDSGTLVTEVFERKVGEVEMDVFNKKFGSDNGLFSIKIGNDGVVFEPGDGRCLFGWKALGEFMDKIELA